jgi:MoxR-like ATPase
MRGISREVAKGIVAELSKVLRGHEEKVEVFTAAQILGLPTLLLGSHGTGKTRLVKTFAKMLYKDGAPIKVFIMLLKSSHKPLDVFYSYDIPALMRGEEKVIPKAIDADLVFLDEVFANEIILSALKDFLEERVYDRYTAKWLFFVGATNPGNDFYQNVLIQRNMADLDRFDVIIPMTPPASTVVPEVLDIFDEARSRENDYEPELKVDVSEIPKVREEILTAVKMSKGAKAYLWLMSMAFSTCYYHDEVTGNKSRADRFNVLDRLPCERCTFKKFTMCNYALSPMRFARSTTFLSKALAWIEGCDGVSVKHVRTAVKYALPLRLVATREEVKLSAPTIESFIEQAVRSFENYALYAVMYCKEMLKYVLELDNMPPLRMDDPLMRVLYEDFSYEVGRMRSALQNVIERLTDEEALEALSTLQNVEIASRARKRLEEIRGVLVIVQPKELKMLLNILVKKDFITEDELADLAWKLNTEHGFELDRKGLVVEKIAPRGVRVKGEKAVVEEIKKALEEMRRKVEAEKAEKASPS